MEIVMTELKKKKQHYVPKCYLERWAIPDKHQIHVYDTKLNKTRINNIDDVASENHFYDIDFSGILSEDDLKKYGISDLDPAKLDDQQYIENFFANQIEGNYSEHLKQIVDRTRKMTPWELTNCCFISEEKKFTFSFHLAWQYIRVKAIRNSMADSADCLEQVLHDMGASSNTISKYSLPKSRLPFVHGKMILDFKEIEDMAHSFFNLTWLLHVNRTKQPFFTSDSPIGTVAHIKDPILPMSGLKCRGVEAYFPLAPDLILLMFDGSYHKFCANQDRRINEIDNSEVIKYINSRCAQFSERCVFSCNGDYSVIQEMLRKNPNILNQPHTVMHWGGKTYTPRRGK